MSTSNELHVVFGATGGAGSALIRELIAGGKRVRAVSRSGKSDGTPGVEVVKGDAADPASARAASAGATTIYHAINVPYQHWYTQLPLLMHNLIDAAASANARLVYIDNLYMYGQVNGAITEDRPNAATTRKGPLRAELAQTLLDAQRSGKVRATIGRAADFYGPGVTNALANEALFRAVLNGKTTRWPGKLDMPHTLMFIDDFAKGLVILGTRDEALGQVWILPHAQPITGREFIRTIAEEAGTTPKPGVLSGTMVRLAGIFNPLAREFAEMLYQFDAPFIVDSSKFEHAFGLHATSYRDGIRATLASLRQPVSPTQSLHEGHI